MESLLAAEVPEEDLAATHSRPFRLGFRRQETFGIHCGDEKIRRWNEELQANLLEQTKAANEEHDRQRLRKVDHRRRLLRSTLLLRMRENFTAAVRVREPHAVRRLRQYTATAATGEDTELSATAMSTAMSTLSHLGVPAPRERPKVRIAPGEGEGGEAALSEATYQHLQRGLRVVDEFDTHGKLAPGPPPCPWDREAPQPSPAPDSVPAGPASRPAATGRPLWLRDPHPTTQRRRPAPRPAPDARQAVVGNPPRSTKPPAPACLVDSTASSILTSIPVRRPGGQLAGAREPPPLSGEDIQRDLAAFETRLAALQAARTPLRRRALKSAAPAAPPSSTGS
eukprot:EG_transcript_10223